MIYPVIKEFMDKFTKEIYKPGREIPLDDTERIFDLQKRGLIGKAVAREIVETEPVDDFKTFAYAEAEPKHLGGGWYLYPDGTKGRKPKEGESD